MDIQQLSASFAVRALTPEDTDSIYALCRGNELFYRFHPPFVTKESIAWDMTALPPGKSFSDKHYIGFFEGTRLAAVMDLIADYPSKGTAFIGLFMVDAQYQGKGVGSGLIRECIARLRLEGYTRVQLGTDKGNPQSNAFWAKNGFLPLREQGEYILRELVL